MKHKTYLLILEYLQRGGLFNPELMDHDKVRDMILEISKESSEPLIFEYLKCGGLSNPELMDHKKVRDMILKIKDEEAKLQLSLV